MVIVGCDSLMVTRSLKFFCGWLTVEGEILEGSRDVFGPGWARHPTGATVPSDGPYLGLVDQATSLPKP